MPKKWLKKWYVLIHHLAKHITKSIFSYMINAVEDNTVLIVKKAIRYFNLHVTNESITEVLKSHSQYPSLSCICDAFKEWKIEHYPLQYTFDELKEIKYPFIAHLNDGKGYLIFITKIINDKIYYFDSGKSQKNVLINDFKKLFSGSIILINPNEHSCEKDYFIKRQNEILNNAMLPLAFTSLLILSLSFLYGFLSQSYFSLPLSTGILIIIKILGIGLSSLLVLHELKIHNSIGDKICHLNKKSGCNAVLDSAASKIFGWLSWADMGLLYFIWGYLCIISNMKSHEWGALMIGSFIAMAYPFFSIYYQGFVIKKWCPLCIGVQILVVSEFLLWLPQFSSFSISIIGLINSFLTFLILGLVYLLLRAYFRQKAVAKKNQNDYFMFKRTPEVFNALLLKNTAFSIPVNKYSIIFGNRNAQLNITAFLSLNCTPCANAFDKIKSIASISKEINLNIVFALDNDHDSQKAINTVFYLYQQVNKDQALTFMETWYKSASVSRNIVFDKFPIPEDFKAIEEIKKTNLKLFDLCGIKTTPAFLVNGYPLPNQYDIADTINFVETFVDKPHSLHHEFAN